MRKIISSFAWLALLVVAFPVTNVFAEEESPATYFPDEVEAEEVGDQSEYVEIIKPANAQDLKAAENSSTIEEAYWYVNEKGEDVQVTKVKVSQADRGIEYDISIDKNINEYVVKESRSLIPSISPSANYNYSIGATYTTRDPVLVDLNRSRHEMTWGGNANDAWKVSRKATAWGANPSSLGTHWYIGTNKYEGYVDNGKNVYSSTYHSYYNWDFGSNSKRTDVWHRVNIQGHNDGYAYVTAQNGKSGEGSALLSFKLRTY